MTPTIDVSDADVGALGVLAKVFGTDRAGAVSRLVEGFAGEADLDLPETRAASPRTRPDPDDDIAVHASYKGQHVTARLGKPTNSVTITSGPLEGKVFKTPSAAARAVVGRCWATRWMNIPASRSVGTGWRRSCSSGVASFVCGRVRTGVTAAVSQAGEVGVGRGCRRR